MISIPRLSFFAFPLNPDLRFYCFTWAIVLMMIILSLNIVNSRVGRALLAIHGSENAALGVGVNVSSYKVQIFVLSAVFASIAGSLYAHFVTFISPSSFGFMQSILLVTMVVIGSMYDLWGACLGALILTILPEYLHVFHDYEILIFGIILMIIMILMPKGLFIGAIDGIRWIKEKFFGKRNDSHSVGI